MVNAWPSNRPRHFRQGEDPHNPAPLGSLIDFNEKRTQELLDKQHKLN